MTAGISLLCINDYIAKFEKYKFGPSTSDLDIDIENVRYQHPPIFMKFLTDDKILLSVKYYDVTTLKVITW